MTIVSADISENGKYILVWFRYDRNLVHKAKSVPSYKFMGPDHREAAELGPHWRYRADIDTARLVREAFGDALVLSDALKAWGKAITEGHRKLRSLATGDDAVLEVVPKVLPEVTDLIAGKDITTITGKVIKNPTPQGRPYQRADIRFMKESPNPLNANQPGTGKTIELIAAIHEEELDDGPNLVIAPRTSVFNVWKPELESFQGWPVLATTGSMKDRNAVLQEAQEMATAGESFWLVVNWSMVRYKKLRGQFDDRGNEMTVPQYPEVFSIEWNTVTADEFHREGLTNMSSLTREGMDALVSAKRYALSGTPMGGVPLKLYGVLNWLNPKEFSSKWRFADQWLTVEEVETRTGTYKKAHGIRPEREEAFYEMLSRYMVRRTKEEVMPWLPPKDWMPITWVQMSPKQAKQYKEFALEAEVRIDEEKLTAVSILSEYARLKQFANAYCTIKGKDKKGNPIVVPTEDSPKLEPLEQILSERGIGKKGSEDDLGDDQVIVASQFSRMVDMVYEYLSKKGIAVAKFTGDVSDKRREEIITAWQGSKEFKVLCMTTTAGGVSINLDMADTVVLLDETWNPDDQEQLVDRTHRGSRIHQVTVYRIFTEGTIEEYINEVNVEKDNVNYKILDFYRKGLRAIK